MSSPGTASYSGAGIGPRFFSTSSLEVARWPKIPSKPFCIVAMKPPSFDGTISASFWSWLGAAWATPRLRNSLKPFPITVSSTRAGEASRFHARESAPSSSRCCSWPWWLVKSSKSHWSYPSATYDDLCMGPSANNGGNASSGPKPKPPLKGSRRRRKESRSVLASREGACGGDRKRSGLLSPSCFRERLRQPASPSRLLRALPAGLPGVPVPTGRTGALRNRSGSALPWLAALTGTELLRAMRSRSWRGQPSPRTPEPAVLRRCSLALSEYCSGEAWPSQSCALGSTNMLDARSRAPSPANCEQPRPNGNGDRRRWPEAEAAPLLDGLHSSMSSPSRYGKPGGLQSFWSKSGCLLLLFSVYQHTGPTAGVLACFQT
mmetsp:Transcript_21584/g.42171  ORF Transcript_21584/g.42171 Transcript_21584/m.42171 type:complete len:377 (+) Transcript_21584:697-1827(+)